MALFSLSLPMTVITIALSRTRRRRKRHRRPCYRCGSTTSFLDEFLDEQGNCIYQCSDSDYCNTVLMQAKEDNYAANS